MIKWMPTCNKMHIKKNSTWRSKQHSNTDTQCKEYWQYAPTIYRPCWINRKCNAFYASMLLFPCRKLLLEALLSTPCSFLVDSLGQGWVWLECDWSVTRVWPECDCSATGKREGEWDELKDVEFVGCSTFSHFHKKIRLFPKSWHSLWQCRQRSNEIPNKDGTAEWLGKK